MKYQVVEGENAVQNEVSDGGEKYITNMENQTEKKSESCLLYTSDAADE